MNVAISLQMENRKLAGLASAKSTGATIANATRFKNSPMRYPGFTQNPVHANRLCYPTKFDVPN